MLDGRGQVGSDWTFVPKIRNNADFYIATSRSRLGICSDEMDSLLSPSYLSQFRERGSWGRGGGGEYLICCGFRSAIFC